MLELTLTATNSAGKKGFGWNYWIIEDKSGVYILQPADKSKYSPGEPIFFNGECWDEMGKKVPAVLNWEWRHDQSSDWQTIGTGELFSITAPDKKGEYHLKLSNGSKETQIKIIIQAESKKEKSGGKKGN